MTPDVETARPAYSVSEITRDIKLDLEGRFNNLWVAGELSNLKEPSSGHAYFTLKDSRSQLPAVMFRSARRFLRFRPADGMAVVVYGHLTVYEPRGAYQIQVERMEPRGKGALQIAFEQLKQKLAKEGLFDRERKRPLPMLPQRIGVVTSPSGAAVGDLCRILHRRYPNLAVTVYPAQVQGDLAAAEITKGIQVLNRLGGIDVVVLARGGGSLEDLWPFNEESVARAIASSKIPVVSAVGHEQDFTISDFVADLRAPTPSAAAELVVERKEDFQERVTNLSHRLQKASAHRLQDLRAGIERWSAHQAFAAVRHSLEMKAQRLDETSFRMRTLIDRRLSDLARRIDETSRRLETHRIDRRLGESKSWLTELRARLEAAALARRESAGRSLSRAGTKLQALSPLAVLGRGYSLTWGRQGNLLRRASEATVGESLRLRLHHGELDCRVEAIRPDGPDDDEAKT